jgi:hypothetical protein
MSTESTITYTVDPSACVARTTVLLRDVRIAAEAVILHCAVLSRGPQQRLGRQPRQAHGLEILPVLC